MSAMIEADRVVPEPRSLPLKITAVDQSSGAPKFQATCSECETELWGSDHRNEAIVNVRIGTLDVPSLMEPDIHCFASTKVAWVAIPEGARKIDRFFEPEEFWPKESLRRYKAAVEKFKLKPHEMTREGVGASATGHGSGPAVTPSADEDDEEHELDKTPTAQSPSAEEDLEFERKCDETEKELLARLEKLTMKLADQEKIPTTQAV